MNALDAPIAAAAARVLGQSVPGPGGCLLWLGGRNDAGYGYIRVNGRSTGVHRVVFLARGGQLLHGEAVHHLCGVRHCVAHGHLAAVTASANAAEALATHALRNRITALERALRSISPAHPLLADASNDNDQLEYDLADHDAFDARAPHAA
ncbi:HNH endonuclease [Crossiella sp. CA198]|uniref:HNH endonuclease n=1 Tax=Crossiella sp. CA198 TaxID=3455607 RepID=UPI003F8D76AD